MKTLIISGTAKIVPNTRFENGCFIEQKEIHYKLQLLGQTAETPLVQCIGYVDFILPCYEAMQDACRDRFARYFKTDLFNIISIENITLIQ